MAKRNKQKKGAADPITPADAPEVETFVQEPEPAVRAIAEEAAVYLNQYREGSENPSEADLSLESSDEAEYIENSIRYDEGDQTVSDEEDGYNFAVRLNPEEEQEREPDTAPVIETAERIVPEFESVEQFDAAVVEGTEPAYTEGTITDPVALQEFTESLVEDLVKRDEESEATPSGEPVAEAVIEADAVSEQGESAQQPDEAPVETPAENPVPRFSATQRRASDVPVESAKAPRRHTSAKSVIDEAFRKSADALISAGNTVCLSLEAPEITDLQGRLTDFQVEYEKLTPVSESPSASSRGWQRGRTTNPDLAKSTEVFGFAATAVLRWMGKNEFTIEQATKALDHFGVHPNKGTIGHSLGDGAKGERGPIPDLKPELIEKLLAFKPAQKEKAA